MSQTEKQTAARTEVLNTITANHGISFGELVQTIQAHTHQHNGRIFDAVRDLLREGIVGGNEDGLYIPVDEEV